MELYTAASRNGQRAALAVAECGIACKFHIMDLDGASRKSAEYLAINPFGRIPTLVDPGERGAQPLIIRQSWAILIYLAEKTGRLMPNEPHARAMMWQWVAEAATDAAPTNATVAILRRQIPYVNAQVVEATPASVIEYFENGMLDLFQVANDHLASVPYFAGDEISIADIGFFPTYDSRRDQIASLGFRHLAAWGGRIGIRAAVRKGMSLEAPHQEE